VVLLDGIAWCTRAGKLGTLDTHAGAQKGERATLLATARVPRWFTLPVPAGLSASGIEEFVERSVREHGLGGTATVPFLIEGTFSDVRAHVLNGRCPMAGPGSPETEPVRRVLPTAMGRLVGFYTTLPPGKLTHAGEKTHVHLLVKENEPLACHIDQLEIAAGALLKLPLARSARASSLPSGRLRLSSGLLWSSSAKWRAFSTSSVVIRPPLLCSSESESRCASGSSCAMRTEIVWPGASSERRGAPPVRPHSLRCKRPSIPRSISTKAP